MNERFKLVDQEYQCVIKDVEHGLNFLFVAEGGMGLTTPNKRLAKRIVDFLNSLPPEETLLYPYNEDIPRSIG